MIDGFDQRVLDRLLKDVGQSVTGILETTREKVQNEVRQGLAEGLSPAQLGDRIEQAAAFDEYRAELIARTETATLLNRAAIASYAEFGVEMVTVIDGDDDEICASVNGQEWTLQQAQENPLGHPNCTRDFAPIIGQRAPAAVPTAQESGYVSQPRVAPTETEAYRRALDDPQYARSYASGRTDDLMTDMGNEMGFGGQPQLVSQADLDRYVAAGEKEMWRGETRAKYVEAFTSGDYRIGKGQYGNGIYTAWGDEAQQTAEMFARTRGADGSAMRMTLRADARVVEFADASQQAGLTAGTYDVGRWAMTQGYDAMRVAYPGGGGEYVIFNRTAVRVAGGP